MNPKRERRTQHRGSNQQSLFGIVFCGMSLLLFTPLGWTSSLQVGSVPHDQDVTIIKVHLELICNYQSYFCRDCTLGSSGFPTSMCSNTQLNPVVQLRTEVVKTLDSAATSRFLTQLNTFSLIIVVFCIFLTCCDSRKEMSPQSCMGVDSGWSESSGSVPSKRPTEVLHTLTGQWTTPLLENNTPCPTVTVQLTLFYQKHLSETTGRVSTFDQTVLFLFSPV